MEHEEKAACLPFLRDCHCFNLRRATLAVTALYDRHMEEADVTIQQFCVLRHVRDWAPLSVTELSNRMGLDRTTLSRNLALLEHRGLLTAHPSPGRKRLMVLTSDGKKTLERALLYWQAAQKEIERRLGAEQMKQLEELLNGLLNGLQTEI